jgi:uncharacterized membrane protein
MKTGGWVILSVFGLSIILFMWFTSWVEKKVAQNPEYVKAVDYAKEIQEKYENESGIKICCLKIVFVFKS